MHDVIYSGDLFEIKNIVNMISNSINIIACLVLYYTVVYKNKNFNFYFPNPFRLFVHIGFIGLIISLFRTMTDGIVSCYSEVSVNSSLAILFIAVASRHGFIMKNRNQTK